MDGRLFGLIQHGATLRQLQLVLESGINVNSYNERMETPLMACLLHVHDVKDRELIVRLLLVYNANVNCRNLRGQTPLMYACILDQVDTLNILLKEPNVDLNLQDFEGNSALMYACALGKVASVQLLVNAYELASSHLDPYIINNDGSTALDFASDWKSDALLKLVKSIMFRPNSATDGGVNTDLNEIHVDAGKSKTEMAKKKRKEKSIRIKELAELIENNTELNVQLIEADNKNLVVWKEGDIGKPGVVFQNSTGPTTIDEPNDNITTPILTQCVTVDYQVPSTSGLSNEQKQRKKRNGKRKKSRIQTANVEVERLSAKDLLAYRKEFGDEIIFCNKLYGTDSYPYGTGDEAHVNVGDTIANTEHNASENLNAVPNVPNDRVSPISAHGKLNFQQLSSIDKAMLMSRDIWSVYRDPLPPIPISITTLERVMLRIEELRTYLGGSRYKPGRLHSLDPELWCIIESMRTQLKPGRS